MQEVVVEKTKMVERPHAEEAPSTPLLVRNPVTGTYAPPSATQSLIFNSTDMKQAARLAALQTEVALLAEAATPSAVPGMTRWFNAKFKNRPPGAIVRQTRGVRYRMPRRLKNELIERFCTVRDISLAQTPSVMIVSAHQDDESIGAGSRLCKLTNAYVVHVTDGAPRNPEVAARYGFSSREEYAEARRRELLNAMEIAGVPEDHLICLGYVDGEASLRMVDLVLDIAQLIDDTDPDIIITHPYEGGHTDHDSTAFAVHLACGLLSREGIEPPAVLEMTSYHDRDGERVVHDFLPHDRADLDQRMVMLDQEAQDLKRRMYECFETQQSVLQTFSTAIEKFRPAPRYVFTRPPHAGKLNYEKYGDPLLGRRWRRNAERAMARLRMRKGE